MSGYSCECGLRNNVTKRIDVFCDHCFSPIDVKIVDCRGY